MQNTEEAGSGAKVGILVELEKYIKLSLRCKND